MEHSYCLQGCVEGESGHSERAVSLIKNQSAQGMLQWGFGGAQLVPPSPQREDRHLGKAFWQVCVWFEGNVDITQSLACLLPCKILRK